MPPKNKNSTKAAQHVPGKTPPSWYCRLVVPRNKSKEDLYEEPYKEPYEEDFDEDISELNEREVAEEYSSDDFCKCDDDAPECTCDFDCDETEDHKSENSYTGSDCDYYYELKQRRTKRKYELRDERHRIQLAKEKQRDLEKTKEIEVQKAYKELQESSSREVPTKLDLLNNHHFKLYCGVDFVDHYFDDNFSMKYIEFYGEEVAEPLDPLWFERTEPLDKYTENKTIGPRLPK
ncbi:hypothetical protein ACHAQI_007267 [Fusarium lateritium]